MPRVNIPVTDIVRAGIVAPSAVTGDSTNDHVFSGNSGHEYLEAANTGGAPLTVTIETSGTVDGLSISDLDVSVTNGTTKLIGPFPPAVYNQADGSVNVNVTANTWSFRVYRVRT